MKFQADEHMPAAVILGLRRRGLDVTSTPEAKLLSADDEHQLAYALSEGRVMISHDADMLRIAAAGTPHAGIAYCHEQKYKVGQLISKLLALATLVSSDEMVGRIEFL